MEWGLLAGIAGRPWMAGRDDRSRMISTRKVGLKRGFILMDQYTAPLLFWFPMFIFVFLGW